MAEKLEVMRKLCEQRKQDINQLKKYLASYEETKKNKAQEDKIK